MLSVSEEALKLTANCLKNFGCLSGRTNGQCKVRFSLKPVPFLKVDKTNGHSCSYSFHYGDSHYCTCPVRFELFKRYGI